VGLPTLQMLEYGRTHFELQPNTGQLIEKLDAEDIEISFEELLAQEKKDSYWYGIPPFLGSKQLTGIFFWQSSHGDLIDVFALILLQAEAWACKVISAGELKVSSYQ
jgi:hypothetical protein